METNQIANSYMSTMKQMDIDYDKELTLINKLKIKFKNDERSLDKINESLNFERESFFSKYSWTIITDFFHIPDMRNDYLSKSGERCKSIYDSIYNSD